MLFRSGKYSIENNPSFFFSKANFIKLVSFSEPAKLNDNYYDVQSIDDNHKFLVCSEVFTNTGIKCSYFPIDCSDVEGFTPFELFESVDSLKRLEELSLESVTVEEIINIINQMLEEVINNTTGKQ